MCIHLYTTARVATGVGELVKYEKSSVSVSEIH